MPRTTSHQLCFGRYLFCMLVMAVVGAPAFTLPAAGAIIPGHTLEYDAGLDTTPDNGVWEDLNGTSAQHNWDLGANVTHNPAPTTGLPGITGSYVFPSSGTNDGADKATTEQYESLPGNPTDADASFEFWFKPASLAGGDQVLWETGGSTDGTSLTIRGGSTLRFTAKDGGGSLVIETPLTGLDREFIHAFATYDKNTPNPTDTLRLYINGAEVAGSPVTADNVNDWAGADDSGLGGRAGATGGNGAGSPPVDLQFGTFAGQIAVHRFYESALSAAEVGENFVTVAGEDVFFDDGAAADSDWGTGENWSNNIEPIAAQNAYVGGGLTADITQVGEVADLLIVGHDGAILPGDGTVDMTGGSLTVTGLRLGQGTTIGTFNLIDGALTVGDAAQAVHIGDATGATGRLIMGDGATAPTLDYFGGRFEVGTADGAAAYFELKSGTVTGANQNFIIGQGDDSSVSDVVINGGSFTTTGDLNMNDGTATYTQTGGTVSVNDLQFMNNGANTSTMTIEGGVFRLDGQMNDRAGTSILNLGGTGRLEISGSNATRAVEQYSQTGSSVLQLDLVDNVTGVSAPLNVIDSAGFTDTPTIEIVEKVTGTASQGTIDTWIAGTGAWDTDGSDWDLGFIPALANNGIVDGDTFTVIQLPAAGSGHTVLTSGTAGWTVDTSDPQLVKIVRNGGPLPGGPATAAIDDAASIVARTTDLRVAEEGGADAAAIQISAGSLTLEGTSDLILGGGADGSVDQTGGTVTVGGNLIFGPDASSPEGGTYDLNGGVLNIAGDIIESAPSVDGAQFHVDGGVLNLGGDSITVQSFRVGDSGGSNGQYTLVTGKTITNTGTFVAANSGTGLFVNDGGAIDVENRLVMAESGSGDGTFRHLAGTTTVRGGIDVGNADGARGTFDLVGGTVDVQTGGFNVAESGENSQGIVRIGKFDGSTSPVLNVSGGNFEAANEGLGVVTMYGGSFNLLSNNLIIGQADTSNATFTLKGGVVDLRPALGGNVDHSMVRVPNSGTGVLNVEGGEMWIGRDLELASGGGASEGTINQTGGAIRVGRNLNFRDDASTRDDTVNVAGGLMEMTGGGAIVFANATDRFNLSGGMVDMKGGSIGVTEPSGQFAMTGGVLKDLGYFGHAASTFTTPDVSGTGTPQDGALASNEPWGEMTPANVVSGKLGGAIDFDGQTDYIDFGAGTVLGGNTVVPVFSMSMWFQRDQHVADNTNHDVSNVLAAHSGSGNDHFEVGSEGTILESYVDMAGVGDFSGDVPAFPTKTVQDGTWHHLAITFDAARTSEEIHYWLDGERLTIDLEDAAGLAGSPEGLALGIARQATDKWGALDGKIDDFGLWSRVLTDGEVGQLFGSGDGATVDSLAAWQDGLDVYAPMDEITAVGGGPVVFVQDSGTMAPGASVGTTLIGGDYQFNAGTYEVEIDGPENGDNDLIHALGSAYLNGSLEVLLDGYLPSPGDEYDVLVADLGITLGPDFALLQPQGLPTAVFFDYRLLANDTTLQLFVGVPEPSTIVLLALGGVGLLLSARRRSRAAAGPLPSPQRGR